MIVIASFTTTFVHTWRDYAEQEGMRSTTCDPVRWQSLVCQETFEPRLVVLDFAVLNQSAFADVAATPAAQLQSWRRLTRGTPLLLAGASFSAEREIAALAAGVAACCEDGLSATEVSKIIKIVLSGGVRVSASTLPELVKKLQLVTVANPPAAEPSPVNPARSELLAGLTDRQRQVADLIAEGASNKDIARSLDITERTVKAHLTEIYERLKITDRLQLAVMLSKVN